MLSKILMEWTWCILVIPFWPRQTWFWTLLCIAQGRFLHLPATPDLLQLHSPLWGTESTHDIMLVVPSVLGHSFTHLLLHPHYGVRKGIAQTRCLKSFIILFVQDKALQKISTLCVTQMLPRVELLPPKPSPVGSWGWSYNGCLRGIFMGHPTAGDLQGCSVVILRDHHKAPHKSMLMPERKFSESYHPALCFQIYTSLL